MVDDSAAWLEFGRLMVADLVVRARIDASGADADAESDTDADADAEDRQLALAEIGEELVEESRARLDKSLGGSSPFAIVASNAGLSSIDAAVLAVALAIEADATLSRLVANVQGNTTPANVTLGSLARVIDGQRPDDPPARRTLLPGAPLRRAGLVDVVDSGAASLFTDQMVVVPHALVWAVLGDPFDDPDLPIDREYFDVDTDESVADAATGEPLVVVVGGGRRLRRAEAASRCAGRRFLACEPPAAADGWQALVREATITGRSIMVELDGDLAEEGRRAIEHATHLGWAILTPRDLPVDQLPRRAWSEYRVEPRDPTDDEWRATLGAGVERTHPLTVDQLDTVARVLPAVGGDLDRAVRRLASGRLEQLAVRIRPRRGWDDIVLSGERTARLRSIVDRYRHADTIYGSWGFSTDPSRGLVALFSGPPGTGKTLASEIIAGELGLDMFKLDLSSIVSKYIGETEKNLEQIFDAAGAGDVVLFFDEADSLFGKRSEVSDARDRYANIEVSYLLQRIERYDGVVILATNFEKNIDEAFLRRIHVRVTFAIPSVAERRRIWAHSLPAAAPTDGVDLDWLAERFELSGASIRSAAVHAAFRAAATGASITTATLAIGVAEELRKLGRLVKEADFGDYFAALP